MNFGRLAKNWKTTLAGLIVAAGTILPYTGIINDKQGTLIVSAASAFGLVKAKDDNVTGGTKENK